MIIPGEAYLIISPSFSGIRCVRRDPKSNQVRLVPKNTGEYDEVVVNIDDIEKLYIVRGVVINKSF